MFDEPATLCVCGIYPICSRLGRENCLLTEFSIGIFQFLQFSNLSVWKINRLLRKICLFVYTISRIL